MLHFNKIIAFCVYISAQVDLHFSCFCCMYPVHASPIMSPCQVTCCVRFCLVLSVLSCFSNYSFKVLFQSSAQGKVSGVIFIASVILSQSGLTQAVRASKITLEQAEYEFLSFVRQHTPPGQCPLAGELLLVQVADLWYYSADLAPAVMSFVCFHAGNSVHADKRFLDKYMPQFMYHLHYRIIDVSTIKELCRSVSDSGMSNSLCTVAKSCGRFLYIMLYPFRGDQDT